jgi:hypothetical protein
MVGALLEGMTFALNNPDETVDLFLKGLPETALNPNAKEFARLGLVLWQRSVDKPEAREHGLGWSSPQGYTDMVDLCMTYLAAPDVHKPELETLFTNQFVGMVKLDDKQWTDVRQRVADYDKVFG